MYIRIIAVLRLPIKLHSVFELNTLFTCMSQQTNTFDSFQNSDTNNAKRLNLVFVIKMLLS